MIIRRIKAIIIIILSSRKRMRERSLIQGPFSRGFHVLVASRMRISIDKVVLYVYMNMIRLYGIFYELIEYIILIINILTLILTKM